LSLGGDLETGTGGGGGYNYFKKKKGERGEGKQGRTKTRGTTPKQGQNKLKCVVMGVSVRRRKVEPSKRKKLGVSQNGGNYKSQREQKFGL